MSSQQKQSSRPPQKPELTPEERAARWVFWRRVVIFSAAGLAIIYLSWAYVWPWLHPRAAPVTLPDEVAIEEVAAEFDADSAAASKKYANKRIVVVGNLVVTAPTKEKRSAIFFQLPGDKEDEARVPVEFFDIDDAGSVDPGDHVSVSGVMKYEGPGKLRVVGAGRMPSPE